MIHRLDASGDGLALHVEVEVPAAGPQQARPRSGVSVPGFRPGDGRPGGPGFAAPVRYELVVSGAALGHGYVVVRDLDIPAPRHGRLEFRADGIWTEFVEEEPGRWTLGLEAFGLRVDDPAHEIGDRVAVGYDLDVDEGMVHGDLLIGTAVIAVALPATFV